MPDIVAIVNIDTYNNEDLTDSLRLTDGEGNPVDLTGFTFQCDVRTTADAPLETYELPWVIVGDPADGTIAIDCPVDPVTKLNPVIPVGTYVYDVVAIDSAGGRDTIFKGKLKIKQGVTRPPEVV